MTCDETYIQLHAHRCTGIAELARPGEWVELCLCGWQGADHARHVAEILTEPAPEPVPWPTLPLFEETADKGWLLA